MNYIHSIVSLVYQLDVKLINHFMMFSVTFITIFQLTVRYYKCVWLQSYPSLVFARTPAYFPDINVTVLSNIVQL